MLISVFEKVFLQGRHQNFTANICWVYFGFNVKTLQEDEDGTQAIWPIMLVLTTTLVVVFFIGAVFVYRHYKVIFSLYFAAKEKRCLTCQTQFFMFGKQYA